MKRKMVSEATSEEIEDLWLYLFRNRLILCKESLSRQDPMVYREIFQDNWYRITKEEISGKTVLDVGANVGMFAVLCLDFGAIRVISVEAQPTIFKTLLTNTSVFPQVIAVNAAVMDSDGQIVHIPNNSANSQIGDEGEPVKTISLAILVSEHSIEKDSILKIDVEGAEYDILPDCEPDILRLFSIIHIEIHTGIHNKYGKSIDVIHDKLHSAGFESIYNFALCDGDFYGVWQPTGVFIETWRRN